MSSNLSAPWTLPPSGQPAQMKDGEYQPSAPRPRLFGQGYREIVGVPKVVQIAQPPPGTDWVYAHSGPSFFVLRSVFGILTTSAAAANRAPALLLIYSGIQIAAFGAPIFEVASGVYQNTWIAGAGASSGNTVVMMPLPDNCIVKDAMKLVSATINIQGGDQWSAIALYVEEFTDQCLDVY